MGSMDPGPRAISSLADVVDGEIHQVLSTCRAPWTSLHLDPRGNVRACELNSLFVLGRIGRERLQDIWFGERAARLRSALARGDLSLGCEGCDWQVRSGEPRGVHARIYDRLTPDDNLQWPRQLELSLSNRCNLQCVQCNGELSSAIRTQREGRALLQSPYDDEFFDELRPFLDHVERLVLIGGEPFLAPETSRVLDLLLAGDNRPVCSVSTNGTIWNDTVERALEELPMEVAVSMDGASAATFEAIRVGASFERVLSNLDRFTARVGLHGSVAINHCLMTINVDDFVPLLELAAARDVHVHVNTVTSPTELSLFHLSADQLGRALDDLTTAGEGADLGRNRVVFCEQLERLQRHRSALNPPASTRNVFVAISGSPTGELAERRSKGLADADIDLSPGDLVTGAGPDAADVIGMDLTGLVGDHVFGLVALLTDRFGELFSTELRHRDGGVEERVLRFAGRSGDPAPTAVRAVTVPLGSGRSRCYLSFSAESLAAGAT